MIMQTVWENIVNYLTSLGTVIIPIVNLEVYILGLIALIPCILLVMLIFRIIRNNLQSMIKYRRAAPDLFNGIRFSLRIIQAIIIIWLILILLGIPDEYLLIITGLITTALAFASVNSLNNFIAGIWINFSDPFEIGDYVKIGSMEGVIIDILITNTRIKHKDGTTTRIPNMVALKSNIINYSVSMQKTYQKLKDLKKQFRIADKSGKKSQKKKSVLLAKRLESEISEKEEMYRALKNAHDLLKKKFDENRKNPSKAEGKLMKKYTDLDTFIQYVFTLEMPKRRKKNAAILDSICKKWGSSFLIPPQYALIEIGSHFKYEFKVTTPDPEYILEYLDDFITDIYINVYSDEKF